MGKLEKEDFYLDENGWVVLTESYLLKQGHCCQSGCKHCPYGFKDKVDPNIPVEWQNPWGQNDDVEETYDSDLSNS